MFVPYLYILKLLLYITNSKYRDIVLILFSNEQEVKMLKGIQYFVPVSYTHLDVYKRQVQTLEWK